VNRWTTSAKKIGRNLKNLTVETHEEVKGTQDLYTKRGTPWTKKTIKYLIKGFPWDKNTQGSQTRDN